MKKIIIFCLFIVLIVLSGCMSKFHSFDFNASSSSDCAFKCEELMNKYYCYEAVPSYSNVIINNKQMSSECSCFIRICRE